LKFFEAESNKWNLLSTLGGDDFARQQRAQRPDLVVLSDGPPWTVEPLAEAAGMSRSAFAARFKELLGQTPLEYVTEWRMQKAMRLLQRRDKKLIDVARSVGYESDAAFSKAFQASCRG
jgi:AraC-like DNA-binding protein